MGPLGAGSPERDFHFGPDLAPRIVCASRGTVKISRTSREPHIGHRSRVFSAVVQSPGKSKSVP
jgi:hypothetical protein